MTLPNKIKWLIGGLAIGTMVIIGIFNHQTRSADKAGTIDIGAAIGLTGDSASWGEMSLKGAQMAADELNAQGGINGRKIEFVTEDTKSTAVGSISAVQKLVSVDHVAAIFGPTWLDEYQGSQGIVSGTKIPMISPDAGAEAISTPKVFPNVFSSWYRSQSKISVLIPYLASIGVKKMAIVMQNDSYYTDFGNRLKAEAVKYGITITDYDLINAGEGDLRTLMTKIKENNPDITFVALYDQKSVDGFFKDRAQINPSSKIAGDELWQDYLDNPDYAKDFNGMYFFAPVTQDASFEVRFKQKYKGEVPKFAAANGYDTIMILAQALKNSPQDPVGYIKNTEFNTVTFGKMRFDSIHGVETNNITYVMKQFVNGKVIVLQ